MRELALMFLIVCCCSSQANADVLNGLVGWWKLDEASGNAVDSSGQGNTGTATGTTVLTSGCKKGNCRSFNGTSDNVSTPSVDLTGTNAVSIAFWLYKSSYANDDKLAFEISSNTNLVAIGAMIDPNSGAPCSGSFQINVQGNGGNNTACYTRASTGSWHHYVVIFNKGLVGANEPNLYLDGVLQTASSRPNTADNTNNFGNVPFYIMSRAGSSLFGDGQLDDVRVYNRALSAGEVFEIFQSQNTFNFAGD